jgi:hypothetical protein
MGLPDPTANGGTLGTCSFQRDCLLRPRARVDRTLLNSIGCWRHRNVDLVSLLGEKRTSCPAHLRWPSRYAGMGRGGRSAFKAATVPLHEMSNARWPRKYGVRR